MTFVDSVYLKKIKEIEKMDNELHNTIKRLKIAVLEIELGRLCESVFSNELKNIAEKITGKHFDKLVLRGVRSLERKKITCTT